MEKLSLELTIDEANLILEALGNMPFNKVYGLIGKIQQQASAQLGSNGQLSKHEEADELKGLSGEENEDKEP